MTKKNEIRIKISKKNYDKIKRIEDIDTQIKKDSDVLDLLKGEIKDIALSEWIKTYEESGWNPSTIIVEASNEDDDSIAEAKFIVKDAYAKIDEKKYNVLLERYGDKYVSKNVEYAFESEMLKKYSKIITSLIKNCEDIPEEDKSKLFKSTIKYTIKSGSVDNLYSEEQLNENIQFNIKTIINDITPTMALQNFKIINK